MKYREEDLERAIKSNPFVNNDYVTRFTTLVRYCISDGLGAVVEVVHNVPILMYEQKYGSESVNPFNQDIVKQLNGYASQINTKLEDLCITEHGQIQQVELLFDVYCKVWKIFYNEDLTMQIPTSNEALHSNT